MKNALYLLALVLIGLSFGCQKEPKPSIYGKWETVTSVGFKFQYDVLPGYHCRKLPETFGETSFCYEYQFTDEGTIEINSPNPERWEFEFLGCGEVAEVWVTFADSTKQQLILNRIE